MESNVWSALHWLAPMGFYNEKQGLFNNLRNCIILLWIADNNSNVSSLIAIPGSPLSDFTQTSELQTIRKNKTEQQRELIINKSLPVSLLSLSHWPQDEPTYTAFTMKSVFFFLAWCQKFLAVCGEMKWNAVNWICSCSTPRLPQPWSWWPEFDFCICQILKITDSYKEKEKMRAAGQDSVQDISLR